MKLSWLIPVGLGASVALGLTRLIRPSKSLGATARRGPRTGAIEVDRDIVNKRVEQILETFTACPLSETDPDPDFQTFRPHSYEAFPVRVNDAATGDARLVNIRVSPRTYPIWNPGGGGMWLDKVHDPATKQTALFSRVELYPNKDACNTKNHWRQHLRRVLAHELAHASDPYGIRGRHAEKTLREINRELATQSDRGLRRYHNSVEEMAAQLTEVKLELEQEQDPRYWAVGDPVKILRGISQRFVTLERFLTPANRRRFLRLAARLKTARDERRKKYHGWDDREFRRMMIEAYKEKYAKKA